MLAKIIAPEVLSKTGKSAIIFIYIIMIIVSANGVSKIKTLFNMDLFVTEDFSSFDYI